MFYGLNKILRAMALTATLAVITTVSANNVETSEVDLKVNLPIDVTLLNASNFDHNIASTYHHKTEFHIYDSLGELHKQLFYFIKVSETDWLVATSVDGMMLDFQDGSGADLDTVTENSVGASSGINGATGFTAGRLIFAADGSLTTVTAGDNAEITTPTLNRLRTERLGSGIISNGANENQQILLDFNVDNSAKEPTHYDDPFIVWSREQNGTTARPITLSIEQITGSAVQGAKAVAINNNSEIILNTTDSAIFRTALGELITLNNHSNGFVKAMDLNNHGMILGENVGNHISYWQDENSAISFAVPDTNGFIALKLTDFNMLGGIVTGGIGAAQLDTNLNTVQLLSARGGTISTSTFKDISVISNGFAGISNTGQYIGFFLGSARYKVSNCPAHLISNIADFADPNNPEPGLRTTPLGIGYNGLNQNYTWDYLYSTPAEQKEDSITLYAKQVQQFHSSNHCNRDAKKMACRIIGGANFTVGDAPDSIKPQGYDCKYDVFNTNLAFGKMESSLYSGEFDFVTIGVTDNALDGQALTIASPNVQRLEDVLDATSKDWSIVKYIDINEHGEVIAHATFGSSTEQIPVIISSATLNSPGYIEVRQSSNANELIVDWSQVDNATSYQLHYTPDGGNSSVHVTTGLTFTLSNITVGHTFRVKACDDNGCSFFAGPVYGIPFIDSDNDGLSDDEEADLGTDPNDADSDDDGLGDFEEVNQYGTDPNNADTDGDGLNDNDEINVYSGDPNSGDTDGDGVGDFEETQHGTALNNSDTDGDGLPDGIEIDNGFDPTVLDTDGDGIDDLTEYNNGLVWVPIRVGEITIFIQVFVAS